MQTARMILAGVLACAAITATAQTTITRTGDISFRDRLPEDEIIYFVLPDRFENGDTKNDKGGLKGDRFKTGFDPAHKGFYHGGDLKGLTQRLDYIQGMGVTAIWFAPIFKNKPVQGGAGNETAGYHGYWVTDFTSVDPHYGTNEEFSAFVDAAHKRGIKVYMDIIANHTADVIYFTECEGKNECLYRSKADYPYSRKGGTAGAAVNDGFAGDGLRNPGNFSRLINPNYAYTVKLPKGEGKVKIPAWLNDPQYYHNRGDSTFSGESSQYGDFVGLDDLFTENPRVVAGFIDIYGSWIDRFGIDGFRIDTAKHVNPEFWQSFVPAMLERAKAKGIPNFHIFGEVATQSVDPALLARHTRVDKLPAVLDFASAVALVETASGKSGSDQLARLYADDALYEGGEKAATRLPTFLGNHDFGRFAMFVKVLNPQISREEHLARVRLGLAMLMTMRGVPTIYSGDEQGFVSDGNDQAAREDMFASKVASYNDNVLLGTNATTADANFDIGHPLYKMIAQLSALRRDSFALRRGKTLVRTSGNTAGLIAVSRFDPQSGAETVMLFNTSNAAVTGNVEVDVKSLAFTALAGSCPVSAAAPGSVSVSLPPLGYAICAATIKTVK